MRRTLVMLFGVLSSGCFSMVYDAQAGAVSSTRFTQGRYGGAVQLAAGGNLSDRDRSAESVGPGLDVRGKFTEDIQQVSFGPHLYLISSSWVTPYARAGATLLEVGSVDGAGTFGSLGPRGEVGMFFGPFVISTFAEYDLRWTSQDHEGFVGVMAGIGTAVSSKSPREALQIP